MLLLLLGNVDSDRMCFFNKNPRMTFQMVTLLFFQMVDVTKLISRNKNRNT